MNLRDLRRYRPPRHEPPGLDAFWTATLTAARGEPARLDARPAATPLTTVTTLDVTFPGWGGQPVRAWLHRPAHAEAELPCVVEYPGYGQGRGLPHERTLYAAAGLAHLVVDARGQAGGYRRCDTPDAGGPIDTPEVLTRGLGDPATSYLVRLVTDAVRAVDAARSLPGVDPARVAVAGISQGGGLALTVAGLVPDVAALACDVPFLAHVWRGVAEASAGPYLAFRTHLAQRRGEADAVWRTLSHVDALNFAPRACAPALFSVAGLDEVCPPATGFAAYNHYAGPKDVVVWPSNGHEGGEGDQDLRRIAFLREQLTRDAAPRRELVSTAADG